MQLQGMTFTMPLLGFIFTMRLHVLIFYCTVLEYRLPTVIGMYTIYIVMAGADF